MDLNYVFSIVALCCIGVLIGLCLRENYKVALPESSNKYLYFFLGFLSLQSLYLILTKSVFNASELVQKGAPFNLVYLFFFAVVLFEYQGKIVSFKLQVLHLVPFGVFVVLFGFAISSPMDTIGSLYFASLYWVTCILFLSYSVYGYATGFFNNQDPDKVVFRKFILDLSFLLGLSTIMISSVLLGQQFNYKVEVKNINFLFFIIIIALLLLILRFLKAQKILQTENLSDPSMIVDKYARSRIRDKDLAQALLDLQNLSIDVFTDADLNLEILSDHLKLSKYDVSQVFSIGLGLSFTKYVNTKRCQYAVVLLLDKDNSGDSLEDIAIKSGFNSRPTFYRAFIENYGIAPSLYQEELTTKS